MEAIIPLVFFVALLVIMVGFWLHIGQLKKKLIKEVQEKESALSAADNARKERDEALDEAEYHEKMKEKFKFEVMNLRKKNKKWSGLWVNVKKEINQARKALEDYRVDEAKNILNKAKKRGRGK